MSATSITGDSIVSLDIQGQRLRIPYIICRDVTNDIEIEASLTVPGRTLTYYLRLFQDGIDVKLDPKPGSSLHWLVPSGAPKLDLSLSSSPLDSDLEVTLSRHPRRRSPVLLEIYVKRHWPLADKKLSRRVSISYDDVLNLRSDPAQTSLS